MTTFLIFTRDPAGHWRPLPGSVLATSETAAAEATRKWVHVPFKLIPVEALEGLVGRYALHRAAGPVAAMA